MNEGGDGSAREGGKSKSETIGCGFEVGRAGEGFTAAGVAGAYFLLEGGGGDFEDCDPTGV